MNKITTKTPNSLIELIETLKTANSSIKLIAGGTDLVIWMRENNFYNGTIIDLTAVSELNKIKEEDNFISIGAGVTFTEIHESKIIQTKLPALAEAAFSVGSTQIRNRATIGGNIANASPCADSVPVLMALNAKIKVIDSSGCYTSRNLDEIIKNAHINNLRCDEVITKIKIPIPKINTLMAFAKLGHRKRVAISKLNACLLIQKKDNNQIEHVSLYLGAIGGKAFKAELPGDCLLNKNLSSKLFEEFAELLTKQVDTAIPNRSSRHYKRHAIKGLAGDLFEKLQTELNVETNNE
jgi:xanthine dehydrogenase FAD-binding subunit